MELSPCSLRQQAIYGYGDTDAYCVCLSPTEPLQMHPLSADPHLPPQNLERSSLQARESPSFPNSLWYCNASLSEQKIYQKGSTVERKRIRKTLRTSEPDHSQIEHLGVSAAYELVIWISLPQQHCTTRLPSFSAEMYFLASSMAKFGMSISS